jgi:cytidine deaminase
MPATAAELLAAARSARARAYAPYSGYSVGAALLCESGDVVCGVNVENASYPVSMCAERSALFSAVAQGHRVFLAIAIAGPDGSAISPCGACRQALSEFGAELRIVRAGRAETTLAALLPDAFGPDALRRKEPAG